MLFFPQKSSKKSQKNLFSPQKYHKLSPKISIFFLKNRQWQWPIAAKSGSVKSGSGSGSVTNPPFRCHGCA
jgi:hypothetical protein